MLFKLHVILDSDWLITTKCFQKLPGQHCYLSFSCACVMGFSMVSRSNVKRCQINYSQL